MNHQDYKVRLEVFEGPLDLLLYLIRKEEIDVYNIPIEQVTRQYMEYLELMRMLDLNIAGEFLVMSATLMMIKSRMLLPQDERLQEQEEEEEEDPRWNLVRQLLEYKKFKDVAMFLQELEERQEGIVASNGEGVRLGPAVARPLEDLGLFDLIAAFNEVLSRSREEDLTEIFSDRFSVSEKIDELLRRLTERKQWHFGELFSVRPPRQEVVCTFLALLELIRLKRARVVQETPHGALMIESAA